MERSFLEKQVRRACRNVILLSLVGIIVLVGGFLAWQPNLENLFVKPFSSKEMRDLDVAFLNNQNYIDIDGVELLDTGWYMTTDGKPSLYYYAALLSDATESRLVLYSTGKQLSEEQQASYRLVGKLEKMDSDERDIYEDMIDDMMESWSLTEAQARVVFPNTYLIKQSANRIVDQIVLLLMALGVVLLLGVIIRQLRLRGNYREHKIYKKVADKIDLNADGDVDALDRQINQELSDKSSYVLKQGNVTVTPNFAVQVSTAGLNVGKLTDAAWVYPITTRHYTNGIPTGKTHSIKMCFTTGPSHDINIRCRNEKQKNELMQVLAASVHSAIIGYYKELEALYSTRNFEGFRAAVQTYRDKLAAASGASQAPAEFADKEESVEDKKGQESGEGMSM